MRAIVTVCVLTALIGCAWAGSWSVKSEEFATIADAISCSSATTCVAPVGVNGQGSFIWMTTDGGNTWNTEQEPFELMFLGAAMQGNTAVVADELSLLYNNATGGNFVFGYPKGGDWLCSSQNVEVFGNGCYGAAGEDPLNNGNGASVSLDGGAHWKWYNVSILKTFARYGAYPSANTWYISAGEWPDNHNPADADTYRRLTSRIHITQKSSTEFGWRHFPSKATPAHRLPGDPGWKAQIVKTTDGGKTWVSQFYDEGNFYFNQIGCTDVNHCCAVGESDGTSAPGIRFYCTTDGGNTWTRNLFMGDPDLSVLSLRWIDATHGMAGGGLMSAFGITGHFWETNDGGVTWTNQTVPGQYPNDIAFPSASQGYAVSFNQMDESSLLVYQ
jgi:photosystem II stability/assembly factor-like uncharacterized protein